MPTAWEGFGAVFCQLLAPLMDGCVRNAQFTGYVRNRLPTGLSQSHRLPLKLGCVDLLHLLHDPFPPSGRVYSKISLLHKFGVRSIYLQAKRWEGTVGGPVVQGFVGALIGKKARKGVFITTSTFSQQARNYANGIENLKIILIDGEQLAQLMIDHDVGVTEESRYIVKKVDLDYFED